MNKTPDIYEEKNSIHSFVKALQQPAISFFFYTLYFFHVCTTAVWNLKFIEEC